MMASNDNSSVMKLTGAECCHKDHKDEVVKSDDNGDKPKQWCDKSEYHARLDMFEDNNRHF